ncbi:MAG: hypothetical protein AAB368_11770, partial [bacterium]
MDLDAEHMVCDLVPWERMVQRLGRVNRRGGGKATVLVVPALPAAPKKKAGEESTVVSKKEKDSYSEALRCKSVLKLIGKLPSDGPGSDASPGAILDLTRKREGENGLAELILEASTPIPLRPELTRALVDAWTMTSLREHTGRPVVAPWLRGWEPGDPPQATVVWRTFLPVRTNDGQVAGREVEEFFEAAPPHTVEMLETESWRVAEWLLARGKAVSTRSGEVGAAEVRGDEVVVLALSAAGDFKTAYRLEELNIHEGSRMTFLRKRLESSTVIVDRRLGGLRDGLLDNGSSTEVPTIDDGTPWTGGSGESILGFRVRKVGVGEDAVATDGWRERYRFDLEQPEDRTPAQWLVVEKRWLDSSTEDDRSEGAAQLLDEHRAQVVRRARELARRLGLPREVSSMLESAARLHDEGKKASRWQRAFRAPPGGGPYAKTTGPLSVALLDG